MRVLRSLFPAMAWIFQPTLSWEEGVGWGDLPELLEFGDCPPSPWDSDPERTLIQLQSPQSPQSPMLTPSPSPPPQSPKAPQSDTTPVTFRQSPRVLTTTAAKARTSRPAKPSPALSTLPAERRICSAHWHQAQCAPWWM